MLAAPGPSLADLKARMGHDSADQAIASALAGEAEESFVDVVADLPADPQPPEPVQQREAPLHDPPVHAQPGAMLCAAANDDRCDPGGPDLLAVLVVVIAAVRVDLVRPPALAVRPPGGPEPGLGVRPVATERRRAGNSWSDGHHAPPGQTSPPFPWTLLRGIMRRLA